MATKRRSSSVRGTTACPIAVGPFVLGDALGQQTFSTTPTPKVRSPTTTSATLPKEPNPNPNPNQFTPLPHAPPLTISPDLLPADKLVLADLIQDIYDHSQTLKPTEVSWMTSEESLARMRRLNDEHSPEFEPTVCTSWDTSYLREHLPPVVVEWGLEPYIRWAQGIVRHKTDVIFITHTITYLLTALPSAALLFYHFTYLQAIIHWIIVILSCGPFTILMHQHIHNNGVLSKRYKWLDAGVPYILSPLFGHTWNSYYYHHTKHHHVEGNGPSDVSTTLYFQRDSIPHFIIYFLRLLFGLPELAYHFLSRGKYNWAFGFLSWELLNYAFFVGMWKVDRRATVFVLLIPFVQMRLGMAAGNWGQHALVDRDDPDSDYRSGVTLIDFSNRVCFNDGYHAGHHLNPRRHWRDMPIAFLAGKEQFISESALVFHNIDYMMMTIRLLSKNYEAIAECMVPLGKQREMTMQQRVELLKSKTRRFTREELRVKFKKA